MGLRSWIKRHVGHHDAPQTSRAQQAPASVEAPQSAAEAASSTQAQDAWEPVPAYLPVDAREHAHACVIASAIAAGDHPASEFRVKRMLIANPEHRTVSIIATALAAGALEQSSFTVKNIYKMKEEGSHAA